MITEEPSEREMLSTHFLTIQEALMQLGQMTHKKDLIFERNKYAEGLVQKANLQLLTVRNIHEQGKWFSTLANKPYNYIIDPLSVASALRGAYECMLTLNHVFVTPPNEDEAHLRYLLWAASTFISKNKAEVTPDSNLEARAKNRKDLENTINHLLTLPIVQALDRQSQKTIKDKIDEARAGDGWEYYIDGTALKRVEHGWHGLGKRMTAREGVFANLYKLFSLDSHPTWHSINVIVNGFEVEGDEPGNFRMMDTMLTMSAMIGAFIIYDYCMLFEEVREAFNKLPSSVRDLVNFYLETFKGTEYRL